MTKAGLLIFAFLYFLTGLFILIFPYKFYEMAPGVSETGPFNVHFIRDVALAFLASGSAIAWGVKNTKPVVCLFGVAWVALHGLFHIQMQLTRGLSLDFIAAFDVVGVIVPAALTVFLGFRFLEATK